MSGDDFHCISVFRANSQVHLAELLAGSHHVLEKGGALDAGENWAVVRCHCPREGSEILPLMRVSGCSIIWPVIEENGFEFYQLLVPSRSMLLELLKLLEPVGQTVVERLQEVHALALDLTIPLTDITSKLTPRQLRCLEEAVAQGYYDLPRSTNLQVLARQNSMSRSTFQEHMQKAEATVVKSIIERIVDHPGKKHLPANGRGRPRSAATKASVPLP